MDQYQLTFRLPNGRGWRIRTTSAAEFNEICRGLVEQAGAKVKLNDLQRLWPDGQVAHLHQFTAAIFDAVIQSVQSGLYSEDFDILKTGHGLLRHVTDQIHDTDWKDSACSDIGKRIIKIVLSLALAYLRTQFPAITPATAAKAIAVLEGLLSRR